MIRDLLDALTNDPERQERPFSDDMANCHNTLFRAGASRAEMEQALNAWLAENQPCLFGRMEAKQNRLVYCLLTENDLERGDDHVRERIEEDRADWKAKAQNGDSHGFIIVAVSRDIARAAVDANLLRLAQHLCGLYLIGCQALDEMFHDSVLLEIAGNESVERREWSVGVNFFSAQGDGLWWRDHRFPGGIAYSMNSVGHMARQRAEVMLRRNPALATELADVPRDRLVFWALPTAMRTIGVPQTANTRGTWLAERGHCEEDRDLPPYDVRERVFRELVGHSENRYHGKYHTDETIPSPYFDTTITTLEQATLRDDLLFTYLHSPNDDDYLTMGIGTLAQAIENDANAAHPETEE